MKEWVYYQGIGIACYLYVKLSCVMLPLLDLVSFHRRDTIALNFQLTHEFMTI